MTTTHDLQHAVARLIEAMNSDHAGVVPLAEHVVFNCFDTPPLLQNQD